MPTYDYECTKCHRRFELFQSITAKALRRVKAQDKQCNCNAPVTRLIGTGAAVLFKGTGFYETDYRSESYKKAAKAEASDAKPRDSTESKAATSSETPAASSDNSKSKSTPAPDASKKPKRKKSDS